MSSEWEEVTLGDVLTLQRGMDLPVQDRKHGNVPIVASNGITGYHNHAPVKAPGVVIGRSGSIGGGQYIECDYWPLNTTLWVKDFKSNDPRYCYYLLRSIDFSGLNAGSGVPTLNRNHLHPMRMKRPPVAEQKQISSMLGALDDRIALLRETNATLEAIAQALFKSWFVDFDPVHTKAKGITPEGMDEATAALFPDSFEESELGLVPKGWRVKALDEVADYLNGLALQKFPPDDDEGLPVIKIAQLRKGDTVGADRASRKMKQEYIIQNGDVLFSWSGSLEVEVWCGGEGALNQHLFKVTSNTYPKWFYYLWTKYHLESFRQTAASKATTMGHIQRVHLSQAKVIAPSDEFVSSADKYFAPILDRWIANALQVQTLATLRDTLLPRLISGQLRLSDTADIITETLSGI